MDLRQGLVKETNLRRRLNKQTAGTKREARQKVSRYFCIQLWNTRTKTTAMSGL